MSCNLTSSKENDELKMHRKDEIWMLGKIM